jgi:hypothetical protein
MTSIIVVEKNGTLTQHKVPSVDIATLAKKAGFKTAADFKCRGQWSIDENDDETEDPFTVFAYGKTTGRANQENKYEFPPPIDNTLFFGNVVLVKVTTAEKTPVDLLVDDWELLYDYLYGGFEDICEDSDEDDDDEDEDDGLPRTKSGYVKDDFVVDDNEIEDEDEEDEEEEDEDEDEDDEEVYVKKSRKRPTAKAVKSKPAAKKTKSTPLMTNVFTESKPDAVATYLGCTSELVEEEYEEMPHQG